MSQTDNYWEKLVRARLARRRMLIAGGASAAGALALATVGCGSGSGGSKPAANALLYSPVDTSSKASKGGTYVISQQADIAAFNSGNGGDSANAMNTYSRLVKYDVYKYPEKPLSTTAADAAISWETSPDGLTWTYK